MLIDWQVGVCTDECHPSTSPLVTLQAPGLGSFSHHIKGSNYCMCTLLVFFFLRFWKRDWHEIRIQQWRSATFLMEIVIFCNLRFVTVLLSYAVKIDATQSHDDAPHSRVAQPVRDWPTGSIENLLWETSKLLQSKQLKLLCNITSDIII